MIRDIFQVTNFSASMTWPKSENGKDAPIKELWLKCATKDPAVDEVMCVVYGIDAMKNYEIGDYVLATIDIFIGRTEQDDLEQVIRAMDIKKIDFAKAF